MIDLKYALRTIRSHRWFSLAVIVTIALGIGVNTTVFTLVNAVLFKPLDIPGGDRLLSIRNHNLTEENSRFGMSYPEFTAYKRDNQTFESLEAIEGTNVVISEPGNPPERVNHARVSDGFLEMVKARTIVGRDFDNKDHLPGAGAVAIIGYDLWQTRYGGDASIIGRQVKIDSELNTIIGVMPKGFKFPSNQSMWRPLERNEGSLDFGNRSLDLYGVQKRGISKEMATRDLGLIGQRLAEDHPDTNKHIRPVPRTLHEEGNGGNIRIVFLTMLGAVGFVLLIACANVANMMLSRALTRSRELSVRSALGASRWRIVRQLLIESMVLSCLGGVLGLAFALLGIRAFDLAVSQVNKPYWIDFSMDYVAFSYFASISLMSGVIFGLMPALRASRADVNQVLKENSKSASSSSGGKLAGALVACQFALTMVLLASAGLLVRSFVAMQSLNTFIPEERLFTAFVSLPEGEGDRYEEAASRLRFHEQLQTRLNALPGIRHATAASHLPGGGSSNRSLEIEGQTITNPDQLPNTPMVTCMPGYLSTIQLQLIAGRDFNETDGSLGKEVVIVTRTFAERYWPNESPLGSRLRFVVNDEPEAWMTVIAVTNSIAYIPGETTMTPMVFIPYRQYPRSGMALLVDTTTTPSAIAMPVRSVLQELDDSLPLAEVATYPKLLDRNRWFIRVFGAAFAIFAFIGLLMAALGIYAVVAQASARRTREIAIRIALGATGGAIMKLVISRGFIQLGIGLGIGILATLVATRVLVLSGLLKGVSPKDPLVLLCVTLLLLVIGLLACWLPAQRAARTQPMEALRAD